jgi:MoaA/NifB/PqqE/SkfB family radical SAM enzyme
MIMENNSKDNHLTKELISAFNQVHPRMYPVFFPWILKHPRYLGNALSLIKSFKKAEALREKKSEQGIVVPPVAVVSITSRCNLFCTGCFASANGNVCSSGSEISRPKERRLGYTDWKRILTEAEAAGVFCYLIAGGEPFLFTELFQLCHDFSHQLFVIFTNGTVLSDTIISHLRSLNNTLIAVSIEGDEVLTDARRGKGTYKKAIETLEILEKNRVLSGISVTINRQNYRHWLIEENIDKLVDHGVRMAFLTEMIPTTGGAEESTNPSFLMEKSLMLTEEERRIFRERVLFYRETKELFIIHSPGDEEKFGGCISAGKGFIHITPYGDVTPCPVSNIATHNLLHCSFEEALKSTLFKRIREEENLLETGNGPCALFAHQKEVEVLRQEVGAYRTGG